MVTPLPIIYRHCLLAQSSSPFPLCPSQFSLHIPAQKPKAEAKMFEQSMAAIIPSVWASLASWFTPTILFLFLNLTIATIAITSTLHKQPQQKANGQQQLGRSPSMLHRFKSINFDSYKSQDLSQEEHHHPHQEQQPPLSRSPSVLHRLRSINLYNYFSQEPISATATTASHVNQETVTHFPPQQEEPIQQVQEEEEKEDEEEEDLQSLEEIYSKLKGSRNNKQVTRSKSDTKPTSGEVPTKLSKKMKKSASAKSAFSHFEEPDILTFESRRPNTVTEGHNGKVSSDQVGDTEVDAKADDFINRFKHQLKLQRIDSLIRYKEMLGRASGK